jgi:hypothetical protein
MAMKRTGLVLLVVSLAMLFTGSSSAQGGFEWNHWDIGEALDYTTGKSALASALDAIEGAGWEVRFVVPRPRGGYAVVGRGAKGLHIPQPIEGSQGYDYSNYGGTAVSAVTVESAPTQVTCPGTHHACRVLPPGTYEKAIADKIGG